MNGNNKITATINEKGNKYIIYNRENRDKCCIFEKK